MPAYKFKTCIHAEQFHFRTDHSADFLQHWQIPTLCQRPANGDRGTILVICVSILASLLFAQMPGNRIQGNIFWNGHAVFVRMEYWLKPQTRRAISKDQPLYPTGRSDYHTGVTRRSRHGGGGVSNHRAAVHTQCTNAQFRHFLHRQLSCQLRHCAFPCFYICDCQMFCLIRSQLLTPFLIYRVLRLDCIRTQCRP